MIIAIDGPSGSGKGTLGKRLAHHLDFAFLDTGALYRALAQKALSVKVDLGSEETLATLAQTLTDQDLQEEGLRNEGVGQTASEISVFPKVRQALLAFQKTFVQTPPKGKKGAVLDGRDIGTTVCPQASIKFFVTARIETRALRRFKELQEKGIDVIYESVFQNLKERDARDQNRVHAPLKPAPDAYILDSSALSAQEVFEKALAYIAAQSMKQGLPDALL